MFILRLMQEIVIKKMIEERHGVDPEDVELEWLGENNYNVRITPKKKAEMIKIDIVFGEAK